MDASNKPNQDNNSFGFIHSDSDMQLGLVLRELVAGLRRQWILISVSLFVFVGLATFYILNAPSTYTSTAVLVIDPRASSGPLNSNSTPFFMSDSLIVDSEIEVIQSPELARRVIADLNLEESLQLGGKQGTIASFMSSARSLLTSLFGIEEKVPRVPDNIDAPALRRSEAARRWFARNLSVAREADTYVVNLSFTSGDPYLSARIANAVVDQYFTIQAEAVFDNTRRISDWLSERVQVLSKSVVEAEQAVADYKQENDLQSVTPDQLPNDAEFRAANDQLVSITNQIEELRANASQLQEIIASGSINATITDSVRTQAVNDLQQRYSEVIARQFDLARRYGEEHEQAKRAAEEAEGIKTLILREYQRVLESIQSRIASLTKQKDEVESRIAAIRNVSGDKAQQLVQLRALERERDSKSLLYKSLLDKMNETNQEESYRISPARIVAKATPPDRKSSPRSKLVLAMAVFGGLFFGAGLGFLREKLDNVFRKSAETRSVLGLPLLGIVPLFSEDKKGSDAARGKTASPAEKSNLTRMQRMFLGRSRFFRFGLTHTASLFSEALRSIILLVSPEPLISQDGTPGRGRVVGVTSAIKSEGKSTLAANLASFYASWDKPTAIIDFDVRNPVITRLVRDCPPEQSIEVLMKNLGNKEMMSNLAKSDVLGGAALVYNNGERFAMSVSDTKILADFSKLVEELREHFELIVIDLPPIANLVDAHAVSSLTDHMILAIEWGKTPKSIVHRAVNSGAKLKEKFAGVVYCKVKLKKYRLYNEVDEGDYYYFY